MRSDFNRMQDADALRFLDDRLLADIGLDPKGEPASDADPRFRRATADGWWLRRFVNLLQRSFLRPERA